MRNRCLSVARIVRPVFRDGLRFYGEFLLTGERLGSIITAFLLFTPPEAIQVSPQ